MGTVPNCIISVISAFSARDIIYNLFYNKLCGLFAKFAQFKRIVFWTHGKQVNNNKQNN